MTDTTTNNLVLLNRCTYYPRRMMKNRQEHRPVVYLDETWINAHDGKDCTIPGYYFNNICYNRTCVHIIITVIFDLPGDKWLTCQGKNCCLNPRRCAI